MSEPRSRSMRRSVVVALALLAATTTALPVAQARPSAAGTAADATKVRQDFNGDGYEDLAGGASDGTVNGKDRAGYVSVRYGSARGLGAGTTKVYSQASSGIPGTPEKEDAFGWKLAAADLDGDGYTDLLVDSLNEHWESGGVARTGSRTVLWGGRGGFRSGKVLPAVGSARYQVAVTAAGDFNGDGHQDLVHRGRAEFGPFGRDGRPASVQDGVPLTGEDQLFSDVATGDVDGDGITDIVASVASTERDGDDWFPDHLNYLRGSREGLQPLTTLKDAQGKAITTQGSEVALGDLNGDRLADLVVAATRSRSSTAPQPARPAPHPG